MIFSGFDNELTSALGSREVSTSTTFAPTTVEGIEMRYLTAFVFAFVLIGLLGYGLSGKVSKSDMPEIVQTAIENLEATVFKGDTGLPGTSCWDVDNDGVADPEEDTNLDEIWDSADCRGAQGDKGDTGARGPRGYTGDKGDSGKDGHDGVCVGSCCYGGCLPRIVEVPVPFLVVNRDVHTTAYGDAKVTVTAPVTINLK